MRTINIVSNKGRRGVSTIMGTLIFIGIMFTSIIPMMLVMKQADTIYTKKIQEMEVRDDEKERENIVVYTYPVTGEKKINVKIKNSGNVPVKIVRVWINDQCNVTDELISSNSEKVLGPFVVSELVNGTTIDVKVATERGNVFFCISGPLHYSGGGWSTTSYGICVIIHNPQGGMYKIEFWNASAEPAYWEEFYESHSKEWEDIVATTPVPEPSSEYKVNIYERKGINWKLLPGCPIPTPIDYPNGPPFILVWVDAK